MAERIAQTWPALVESVTARLSHLERLIDERAGKLADETEEYLAITLGGNANTFAELVVLVGPERVTGLLAGFESHWETAAATVPHDLGGGRLADGMALLDFMVVAQSIGRPVPARMTAHHQKWLQVLASQRDQLNDDDGRKLPFLAMAFGAVDLVRELTAGPLLTRPLQPRTFELDSEGFLAHLAAATVQSAPAVLVEPAFDDFLRVFPVKLAANATDWVELLAATCGYFVHVTHRPVGEVALALRDALFEDVT